MKKEFDRLSEIFGFKIPLDGIMMMAMERKVIDIVKLQERLMRDYKYEGSMNEFIKLKFGEEAFQIFEKLTG